MSGNEQSDLHDISQQKSPVKTTSTFSVSTTKVSSHLLQATVKVSPKITNTIYNQAIKIYSQKAQPEGLKNINLPPEFVEKEHTEEIKQNVKKFILKYMVINHLLNQIGHKKITIANHPRLTKMQFSPNGSSEYVFDISIASQIPLKEWKFFSFKAPKRKKYKDLDKQVDLFIRRENENHKKHTYNIIENNDWVNFETTAITENKKPLIPSHQANFWIKINNKHIEKPFQKAFLNKKVGETFIVDKIPFNEEFPDTITENCNFSITVKAITKGSYLSIESLKTIFKLKNKADLHNKLIEVFSYRNDISQRRSIIEEVFHLLLSKHRFEIPKHLTIRKQESLLSMLRKQPDYQVYKSQKDFFEKVTLLAEKLLKEEILIDQISYKENIKVSNKDISNYLALFNNSRLREFVYFKPTFEPIEDSDTPFPEGFLRQAAQREKTLNYIVYTLTK